MPSLKHYPDKPWERHPNDLESWDNSEYICQQKCDGWRLEACKGLKGEVYYLSRHNKSMDRDVESDIQAQMSLLIAEIPNQTQLDGEWLSRRESTNQKEKPRLILFDVIRYDGRWLLQKPYEQRWKLLTEIFSRVDPALMPNISLSEMAEDGHFVEFYEAQKTITHSEGVVIKHKQSTLVGDRKESKKNAMWMKIKYRGMSDGLGTMEHLREGRW